MYILEGLLVYGNNFLKYMRRQHSREEPYLQLKKNTNVLSSRNPWMVLISQTK